MGRITNPNVLYGTLFLFMCFISFYQLPYLTAVLFLSVIIVVSEVSSEPIIKKYLQLVFFITSFVLVSVPYSTKTLTPIMNDKGFYYGYMLDVYNQTIYQWFNVFSGNDILSYFLLMISSHLFGVGNQAFSFFYFTSFLILFFGARKILGFYVLIFLFLFLPQYNYQGLYGNVIRQGFGLSLFILAISCRGRWKYFFGIMSALAHFSFIICIPFYFVVNKIKNITTKWMVALLISSYFIGGVILKYLIVYVGSISAYVNTRVDAYQDGDFGNSIARKVFMTFVFVVIVESIYISLRKNKSTNEMILKVRAYFIMMCAVFFLTISFQEIANRYAFDLMIFVFLFISFYVSSIKSKSNRVKLIFVLLALSFPLYIYINIVGVQYFYFGGLVDILTDTLPDVIQKIL